MIIPSTELPGTRLELTWSPASESYGSYAWICEYSLVLELDRLDVRGEVYEDGVLVQRVREKRLSLGKTASDGHPVNHERGTIRIPFRDGAHIQWDSLRLGRLPMFAVCGEYAMRIELTRKLPEN